MSTPLPRLSVVCPAYQEEEVLPRFHAALTPVLDALAADYQVEVVYVDDGSSDDTLGVLRRLAAADSRVRYLSLSRNFGHQAALTAGLEHATGEVVVSMDSDLQHPPALVPALLERWKQGYDVVLTERVDSSDLTWFKRVTSRGFYWVLSRISEIEAHPAASDFRLLSRPALDALLSLRESHRYLRGMVNWVGFRMTKVPFQAAPRAAGRSSYTLRRMVRLASDGLLSFSTLPLRMPIFPGVVSVGLGLLYGSGSLLIGLLAGGLSLWPVHLLLSVMLLLGGLILFSLGVLGEYIGRIFEQVKQRPVYLLKESNVVRAPARTHELSRAA
jgi:polyisoprenyl-phosphate glycosyltransferase